MLATHSTSSGSAHLHKISSWLGVADRDALNSTNQPGSQLPFQRWFKFKEAFAPQLVLDVLTKRGATPVKRCLDPFGGCGTTGLTCQFLGVHPVLIEVNPFIADLAEAKLATYDIDQLTRDFLGVRARAHKERISYMDLLAEAPATLGEPGNGKRWVFPKSVLDRLLQYRTVMDEVKNKANRRLFRVLLGSIVVGVSNVTVNGKGRKYRGSWKSHQSSAQDVDDALQGVFLNAVNDIARYGKRAQPGYELLRGTCLKRLDEVEPCDVALFSPPYPNSFDYTDIYNLELWVLGYLKTRRDNARLRQATLRSHVQAAGQHTYTLAPSQALTQTIADLESEKELLWDDRLPSMIGAYFDDMHKLLKQLRTTLRPGGRAVIVIGESSYAGIRVRAGHITAQIARNVGFDVERHSRLRTMRRSAQQGGDLKLEERLLELVN